MKTKQNGMANFHFKHLLVETHFAKRSLITTFHGATKCFMSSLLFPKKDSLGS